MEAAGKSAQAAAGRHDAMTRNQEGDGVGGAGASHRPRGFGRAKRGSQTAVGFGSAGGDLAQGGPHFSLKGRSGGEVQGRQFAGDLALQDPRDGADSVFVPAPHAARCSVEPPARPPARSTGATGKVEAGKPGGGVMGGKNTERGLDGTGSEDDGFGFHKNRVSAGVRRATKRSPGTGGPPSLPGRKTGCGPRASRSAKGAGPGGCPPPGS